MASVALLRRGPALGPEGGMPPQPRCHLDRCFYGEVPRWDLKGERAAGVPSLGVKLLRRGPALGPEGDDAVSCEATYKGLLRRGPALGPEGRAKLEAAERQRDASTERSRVGT